MADLRSSDDRDRLIASHQAASDAFDRALLSLSAGSLALSIAFVSNLVDHPVSVDLLEASWILMGMAVLLTLVSFALSVVVHHRLIATGDKGKSYDDLPGWTEWIVYAATGAAGLAFVVGAGFLIAFAIVNV